MAHLTLAKRRLRLHAAPRAAGERILLFRVGDELYGIGIGGLWEVLMPEGVTTLPTARDQICTALAYRGRRLPLIRMGELFGMPADSVPATARVLLTRGQERTFGLLVDEVLGMEEVHPARIAPVPGLATLLHPALFQGLFSRRGRVVLLVNEQGLGGLDEVARFQAASS